MNRPTAARWHRLVALPILLLTSALAHAEAAPVVLGTVERGPRIEEIALNGTVTALRNAELSVSVEGLVTRLAVDTGDRVATGDELLVLDTELARLEGERARAETREAERRLTEAERLLAEGRSARGGRAIAATEVERRASEVAVAEAVLARARAAEQLQAARIARHTLRAPFGGVVAARHVDPGEWVQPGTAAFALVDTDALRLDFQAPQRAAALLGANSELLVELPDGATRPVAIATWLPVSNERARTFLLRAQAPAGNGLAPGMAVRASLRLLRDGEALSVPRDAVNRHPDGRVTVWVAEPGDRPELFKVREQRIEVVGQTGARAYITNGLAGGERIVVRGNEALRPGAQVRATGD